MRDKIVSKTALRNASLGLMCAALLAGCHRVEKPSSVSGIARLEGRCVQVLQPMALVDSGGSKSADVYLSPVDTVTDGDHGMVARVAAGDRFWIRRTLLETTFEDQQVNIVSESQSGRSVALTLLFRPAWLTAARKEASGNDVNASALVIDDALNPELAVWCDTGKKSD